MLPQNLLVLPSHLANTLVRRLEKVLFPMKIARFVSDGYPFASHHRYHARLSFFRPDTHPKFFRHRVFKMPFPADTLPKWVRKERIITFLAFPQERMVQCLPRRDAFDRLGMQEALEQIERLFHVRFVILHICTWRRPM